MAPKRFIQASSARSWKHCPRRAWYDYNPPANLVAEEDRFEMLMAESGLAHEAEVLARFPEAQTATSHEHTQELMRRGASVIYQPVLVDIELGIEGRPDFLIKTERGTYQVADAKLARSLKDAAAIQLSVYQKLLGSGEPALGFLGSGEIVPIADEHAEDAEKFLTSLRIILDSDAPPKATFGETKCSECPYDALCRQGFIDAGEITLVYGVDARSAPGLAAQGINTIQDLASAEPEKIADVPHLKGFDKKRRAVLQAKSFLTGEVFQTAPISLPAGTWIHFDVEGNPLTPVPEVYLWGLLPPPYAKESFEFRWSDGSDGADYAAWLQFLEKIKSYRTRFPDLVLAHYSPFEVTQIKLYTKRYAMDGDPTVSWLLGERSPLFDLRKPVMNSFVLPLSGYGLKPICKHEKLVNFQWELEESGSQWSVVRYLDYLRASKKDRQAIKEEILSYNRDDVRATRALENWLRSRRG